MNIQDIRQSKILVVDDGKENIELLFMILTKYGFTVLVARSGLDALELIKFNRPDLILMDIMMPGMDGYETCQKIKKEPECQSIPILFISSLSDTQDKVMGFQAGGVDYITKPFQHEELLARVATHLHLHRLKKTLEENNRQLQQEIAERRRAELRAEEANRAKSEFLANMSHELRTPLNGIMGYAQILKRDRSLTPTQQQGLDIIERSSMHLLNLINDILDFAKIEARKLVFMDTVFLLRPFLSGIAEMIRIQALNKNLSFTETYTDELPAAVCADQKRLGQILLNLLGNAVKFTDRGQIGFSVTLAADARIRFEIVDTGIGIPEDKLDNIFSAFNQLADPNRIREGAGLGLAISRNLVELMGGMLSVTSQVGQGTAFHFELKLPSGDPGQVIVTAEDRKVIGYQGPRRRILIVDDKWENRIVLVSFLTSLGFETIEAQDGREGINKAIGIKPDLIFMDLIMPRMDGFEASRQIRVVPELREIPIIAVSASTLISPDQIRDECGCDDYIPKPIHIQEVMDKIGRHLSLKWLYENDAPPLQRHSLKAMAAGANENYPIPAKPILSALYESAGDGNFQQLSAQLHELEQTNPEYQIFIQEIQSLAKELEEERICQFIARHIGEKA